jgi:hypothetical protein
VNKKKRECKKKSLDDIKRKYLMSYLILIVVVMMTLFFLYWTLRFGNHPMSMVTASARCREKQYWQSTDEGDLILKRESCIPNVGNMEITSVKFWFTMEALNLDEVGGEPVVGKPWMEVDLHAVSSKSSRSLFKHTYELNSKSTSRKIVDLSSRLVGKKLEEGEVLVLSRRQIEDSRVVIASTVHITLQ